MARFGVGKTVPFRLHTWNLVNIKLESPKFTPVKSQPSKIAQ